MLVHTGWSKYWPDKIRYLGWNNETQTTDKPHTNFPGEFYAAKIIHIVINWFQGILCMQIFHRDTSKCGEMVGRREANCWSRN